MASTSPKVLASAVGRRKSSRASVRIIAGKGEMTVNNKAIGDYFPGEASKARYSSPFVVTGMGTKYAATIRVSGGGVFGQLDATTLGVARALVEIDEKFKEPLRTAGLMTRDPRGRESRKVGTGGKARRKKSSPKR